MKALKSLLLTLSFLMILSINAYAYEKEPVSDVQLTEYIKDFIKASQLDKLEGVAMIYTNFIVKERGENFAVDFLITENNEIIILSVRSEDEYYRVVDDYNAKFVQTYSVPLSTII